MPHRRLRRPPTRTMDRLPYLPSLCIGQVLHRRMRHTQARPSEVPTTAEVSTSEAHRPFHHLRARSTLLPWEWLCLAITHRNRPFRRLGPWITRISNRDIAYRTARPADPHPRLSRMLHQVKSRFHSLSCRDRPRLRMQTVHSILLGPRCSSCRMHPTSNPRLLELSQHS